MDPSTIANATPGGVTNTDDAQTSTKPAPIHTATSKTATTKPTQSAPRVDLEPIYAALKALIPNNWTTYKSAISRFVLGFLNQDELNRQTAHYIAIDPTREHLHNRLLCGLHANILRDAPEAGVASWVSANDKPASVTKPITGDAAEQRLKAEIMQLPPRFRHRMKAVKDEPRQPLVQAINLSQAARRLPTTNSGSTTTSNLTNTAATPLSAATPSTSTTAGLSKDQEIRRRYTAPIISESRDLPPPSALSDRVLPICYEEGISAGVPAGGLVGELLSTALDFFVKESLTSMLACTRTKAPVIIADTDGDASTPPPIAQGGNEHTPAILTNGNASNLTLTPSSTTNLSHTTPTSTSKSAHPVPLAPPASQPTSTSRPNPQSRSTEEQGDLRLAWELGEPWLARLMPWFGEKVYATPSPWTENESDNEHHHQTKDPSSDAMDLDTNTTTTTTTTTTNGISRPAHALMNGASTTTTGPSKPGPKPEKSTPAPMPNGTDSKPVPSSSTTANKHEPEPPDDSSATTTMMIDETDWGWKGAGMVDQWTLGALLDDCLAVGD